MTARPILSRSRARPEAGDGSDVGRALGRVMAEIDDIAVSTPKSITLTTLLKIAERHAPQEAEAAGPGAQRPAGPLYLSFRCLTA